MAGVIDLPADNLNEAVEQSALSAHFIFT